MNWIDNLKGFFSFDDETISAKDIKRNNGVTKNTAQPKHSGNQKSIPVNFDLRMLIVTDTHGCLYDDDVPMDHGADVCLLLGDLSIRDIEIIKDRVRGIPIYGILGNHDGFDLYERCGIENIHGKVVDVNDVKIAGIQGSLRYKYSDMPLYTDEESVEMADNIGPADILISHDSPKFLHGTNDYAHSGLQGITKYCEDNDIPLNIHGHHHYPQEFVLPNGTRSICCYGVQIIDTKNI